MAPEDVAEQMLALIEHTNYGGGTVVELLEQGKPRLPPLFNMDLPSGRSVESVGTSTTMNQLPLTEMKKIRVQPS
jgi:hypothetical protein